MGSNLTKRETDVISWFLMESKSKRKPCDLMEIDLQKLADKLNIDYSNLCKYIKSLKRKGYIECGYRVGLNVRGITCFN